MDKDNNIYKIFDNPSDLISLGREVNASYNPFLPDSDIWEMLENTLPDYVFKNISNLKNYTLGHKVVNDIIMNYYHNERVIKYYLVKKFITKIKEITFFEMNIDSSRIDMCTINGKSTAYEIKTEFDSTLRLEKQIEDYSKVFEYIYIITHKKHLDKILNLVPDFCGVQVYTIKYDKCTFKTIKKASKSTNIDCVSQIRNLSSEDLRYILGKLGYKNIPNIRELRETLIYKLSDSQKINSYFKLAVKNKFKKKWNYLQSNFVNIMPIDMQTFFHSNCNPQWIYVKNSSIV